MSLLDDENILMDKTGFNEIIDKSFPKRNEYCDYEPYSCTYIWKYNPILNIPLYKLENLFHIYIGEDDDLDYLEATIKKDISSNSIRWLVFVELQTINYHFNTLYYNSFTNYNYAKNKAYNILYEYKEKLKNI